MQPLRFSYFKYVFPILGIVLLVSFCFHLPGNAQPNASTQHEDSLETPLEFPNLFDSDTLLELTLVTDLRELTRDVGDKRSYHKGRLSYNIGDSIVSLLVDVRTRGNFRKDRSICNFPPIQIKFNKADATFTLFHGQNKLKLVTHCQNRIERYEKMAIQEYLIYKAYNLFTPESFRVRLARITYKDSEDKMDPLTKFAFFIEDEDDMAYRNNKMIIDRGRIHQEKTDMAKITRLALFQYMVGNTDWGVPTLHNIKLIASHPNSNPIAVPFDFDWASLVDAPYAVPNEKLEIKSIHERLYRGYERTLDELEYIFREFRMLKKPLYDLYLNCPYLDKKDKERVIKYFDEFYEIINNPKRAEYEFIKQSRKLKQK